MNKQKCKEALVKLTAAGVPQNVSGCLRTLAAEVDFGHSSANMIQSAVEKLRAAGVDLTEFVAAFTDSPIEGIEGKRRQLVELLEAKGYPDQSKMAQADTDENINKVWEGLRAAHLI